MMHDGERLGAPRGNELSAEQRRALELFKQSRGTDVHGPFAVMLHSPEVMLRAAELGRHLRYESSLPPHLSEWAIMITAWLWTQNYEWNHHFDYAIAAGIAKEQLDQLAKGERPSQMSGHQSIIYDFSTQLQQSKGVDDAVYAQALQAFGASGIVDLTGINGYYAMLAMMMNVAQTYTARTPLK